MKLYNTRTRKTEDFVPLEGNHVRMYSCGPTVYNYAHIGNLRTYIFTDILRRILLYNNYEVTQVMNITDVGHLTSDADSGEDKMLKGAKREKKTVWEIAEFYTQTFMDDIKKLNIITPNIMPKATEHISEMINMIKMLEEKKYTYRAGGNVYFDTSKFKDYEKFAKLGKKKGVARVEKDPNKKNQRDFALWFTKSKFDEQEMKWDSPWGMGYPGWHIECSAMSTKYLGEQFDIHTGGIDHIQVHHTNEIAQSECALEKKPWVNFWLHGEFLVLKEAKMAKSGENFITLNTLIQKGYEPMHYRYFTYSTHYRMPLAFSYKALDGAKNAYEKLKRKVIELKKSKDKKGSNENYIKKFEEAINNDLNIPQAIAIIWDMIDDKNLGDEVKYKTLVEFDEVLGLGIEDMAEGEIPQEITMLIEEREKSRAKKDYAMSDRIREEIKKKGYVLEDTKEGVKVRKL